MHVLRPRGRVEAGAVVTAALVRTGVVTVCCGGHRPAAGCLCCLECPVAFPGNPSLQALLASGARARDAALRMTLRRAFHLVTVAEIDDHLRDLVAASRSWVAVTYAFEPDELAAARAVLAELDLPHFEGSLS